MVVRKMKEKCKDAARMRREKERAEFVELSKLLPLPPSTTSQLDKASIIRLTSSYLRMRSAFPEGLGENWGNERSSRSGKHGTQHQKQRQPQPLFVTNQQQQIRELGSLILQTLDGFVFALHRDGKIMYISETASVHLGLPQIDLTGSSVFEYVHPSDHNDIYEVLSLTEADKNQLEKLTSGHSEAYGETITCELSRSFCMRMKCILPKRNAGLVSSGYKAIHCNGYLKVKSKKTNPAEFYDNNTSSSQSQAIDWDSYALVAVGHSLLPTASTEVKLSGNSFMFRANLDFKLYFVEAPIVKLLGFEQFEMIGQSLYSFVHLDDMHSLEQSHKSLLDKSQVVTKYYRLMKKNGGFIWIQSYASLVSNPRNMPKPQHIVSICFVLGQYESDESCAPDNYESTSTTLETARVDHLEQSQHRDNHTSSSMSLKKCQRIKGLLSILDESNNSNATEPDNTPEISQLYKNKTNNLPQLYYYDQHQRNPLSPVVPISSGSSITSSGNNFPSSGLIRRPSDDSCSIVSSVASTSASQQSSSSSLSSSSSTSSEYIAYPSSAAFDQDPLMHLQFIGSSYNTSTCSNPSRINQTPVTNSSSTTTETSLLLLNSNTTNANNYRKNIVDRNIQHSFDPSESELTQRKNIQLEWPTPINEEFSANESIEQILISQSDYQQETTTCNSYYFHQSKSPKNWFTNNPDSSDFILGYQNCTNTSSLPTTKHQPAYHHQYHMANEETQTTYGETPLYQESSFYANNINDLPIHSQSTIPVMNNEYTMSRLI